MGELSALRTSVESAEIIGALCRAQATFVNPPRNRTVRVTPKEKAAYEFSYATLDKIVETVRKPLADNGLGFLQYASKDAVGDIVVTRLIHESGQWLEADMPVFVAASSPQAFGSGLSYAKRYALSAMLGIVSEGDDDANIAEGNDVKVRNRRAATQSGSATTRDPIREAEREINGRGPPQPSTYQVAKRKKAEDWIGAAIATIKTLPSDAAIEKWWDEKAATIEDIQGNFPDLHDKLSLAVDARRDEVPGVLAAG